MSRKSRGMSTGLYRALVIAVSLILLCVTVYVFRDYPAFSKDGGGETMPARPLLEDTYSLVWKGETYTRRSDVESFLFIGVDMDESREDSGLPGQADVLLLVVLDGRSDSYTVLQINRDTMTQIQTVSGDGSVTGESFMPICLAHSLGSGGEDSCENTVRSVQYLLPGVEISGYAAVRMETIGVLNDAVGGVTVTVEGDLTKIDPAFTDGAVVHLDGKGAEGFVRARMSLGESNNTKRMERQKQYMNAWIDAARAKTGGSSDEILKLVDDVRPWLVTDLTDKAITSAASRAYKYENAGFISLRGENIPTGSYNRFYADEDSVTETLIKLFYTKAA